MSLPLIPRVPLLFVLLLLVFSILTVDVFALPPCSEAEKLKRHFTTSGPLFEKMKDGESFINNMHSKADLLSDYSLDFEIQTFKPRQTVDEFGKLFFKKPKLMRLQERGEYNRGAEAVICKDGKARAHLGGVAKFLTMTLDPGDKILNAANGDRLEDCDFVSLSMLLEHHLKNGALSRVTEKAEHVDGIDRPVYVLELYRPSEPKTVFKRVYVDPASSLPVRWDDYDYKFPCLSTWKNVKLNVGLSDDLFKL